MRNLRMLLLTALAMTATLVSSRAVAGPLKIPNNFVRGTPAVAANVNANFDAITVAVNDNDIRVVKLEVENAALRAKLISLETFVEQLRDVMSIQTDNQGNPSIVFSAVNVHVNNGTGATDTVNGLGNLVLGYDEPNDSEVAFCSDGRLSGEAECLDGGGTFAPIHKSGSHTLVIGSGHNYSQAGGLVAGADNTVNGAFASVTGGSSNRASGPNSSVTGGQLNAASGEFSSITGGRRNAASGEASSVTGGDINTAAGQSSSVGGGTQNLARGAHASVTGGSLNAASGNRSSVSAGLGNTASGADSSVSGGGNNRVTGAAGAISGGINRSIDFGWAAGSLFEGN